MDFKKTFLSLTQYTVPFGYETELEEFLPVGWKKDPIGNYYYNIGTSETLFTAHLDTASSERKKIKHIIEGDLIKTDGSTLLGGDNKAGCVVLFYLIENHVPGTYYFFIGEEAAMHKNFPHGSLLAIDHNPEYFKKFKRAIAFDRKEKGELVTRQLGYNCCSTSFADSLIAEFSKNGIEYKKDKTGYYTDTAFFGNLIPEITNLSVGVWNEHTEKEYVDIKYIEAVAEAAAKINWEGLPSEREVNKDLVDPRADVEESELSEEQKLFTEVATILDELYYVSSEIRSYTNFPKYFKINRKYTFTQWHEEEKLVVFIDENGLLHVNDKEFHTMGEFKKYMGLVKLSRVELKEFILKEFMDNDNKLTLAQFSKLMYLKGGDFKTLSNDLQKEGIILNKIGKGYEIVKSNNKKYINNFEKFRKFKK